MNRRTLLFIFALAFLILGVGCGGRGEPEEGKVTPPIQAPEEPEEDIYTSPEGMVKSRLTGRYIYEEAANRRPFAVVYNNENRAMPQAGLMDAAIIYEVLAEGVTTRLVAIFEDFSQQSSIIGPVRSSRNYMADIAAGYGAVFVHHGGSPTGYNRIGQLGLNALDGMRYEGSIFWRDANRRSTRGFEHSSVTSGERLLEAVDIRNINMEANADLGVFDFFEYFTAPYGRELADSLRIASHSSDFRFDEERGVYYKYIFGNPHMDEYTDEQIYVSNVLVKVTTIYVIAGDPEGRRNVYLIGSGHGYLATGGTWQRVYWEKQNAHAQTVWRCENGDALTLNQGRTWVPIVNASPTFTIFENDMEE